MGCRSAFRSLAEHSPTMVCCESLIGCIARWGATLGGSTRSLAATPQVDAKPVPPGCVLMAVVGAHLTGQPLHWQLTERKARLVTSSSVRMAITASTRWRIQRRRSQGLVYTPGFGGDGIEVEVWAMPENTVGSFLQAIPPPLTLGTIRLQRRMDRRSRDFCASLQPFKARERSPNSAAGDDTLRRKDSYFTKTDLVAHSSSSSSSSAACSFFPLPASCGLSLPASADSMVTWKLMSAGSTATSYRASGLPSRSMRNLV